MSLELSLRVTTKIPIEVADLTPDLLRDKPLSEIERLPVAHGNQRLAAAELFRIAGSAADERIEFAGDMGGVHWIGTRMRSGAIHVTGNAGRHIGSQLAGGEITVAGDAGDWAGAEMRGGILRIAGSADSHVGAAYVGSPRGMRGGTILVGGDARDEIGHTMRRGLIAVGGRVGDFVAINMIAGSLIVLGDCGARPAAGMRRGTLVVAGTRPELLPTFRASGPCEPLFLRVYLRTLVELGFAVPASVTATRFELFHGDLLTGGRGEVLVRM